MKIDHIAIAVNDVEASAKVYQKALGIDEIEFETVESEGVKVAIISMENGRIELMQPTKDDSPIKKFLDKKGPGLHHMALETDNIEGEVEIAKLSVEPGATFNATCLMKGGVKELNNIEEKNSSEKKEKSA